MTSNDFPFTERNSRLLHEQYPGWITVAIKAEAQRRIVGLLGLSTDDQSAWVARQINMTARYVELLGKVQGGEKLSESEEADKSALLAFWAKVKAIRAYSNELEAGLTSETDIYTGWPS